MPKYLTYNDDWEPVMRYRWPAVFVTPTNNITPAIRDWRKAAIKEREEFAALQKTAATREDARFFKEQANRAMRIQRACTLMIPWFGEPDNNQRPERPKMWPLELSDELDEISNSIILQFG